MRDELRGRTILLVDDEVHFGLAIRRMLESSGATPVVARSIAEARKALGSFQFDAAIVDLLLLNGNGVEFIAELGETYPALPCILCTGVDTGSMGAPARSGVYYMQKPVTWNELLNTLLEAMRTAPTQPSPPPDPPSNPHSAREDSTVPHGVFYHPNSYRPEPDDEPTKVVNVPSTPPPPPPDDDEEP